MRGRRLSLLHGRGVPFTRRGLAAPPFGVCVCVCHCVWGAGEGVVLPLCYSATGGFLFALIASACVRAPMFLSFVSACVRAPLKETQIKPSSRSFYASTGVTLTGLYNVCFLALA